MTDVFVIGGGPAGLAAAIAARKKGFEVTLADGGHPPLDKPCGEGMLPGTLAALDDLGVKISPSSGVALQGIRFLDGSEQAQASFANGLGMGMRRPVLHKMMVETALACGVKLLWNTPVSGILPKGVVGGEETVRTRWIVGADGGRSLVRRWCGLEAGTDCGRRFACRRHYRVRPWSGFTEIYWGRDMQAYVTPVGACEMCMVVISYGRRSAWEEAWREFPSLAKRMSAAVMTSAERGTLTGTHSLERVYRSNVALVGDASGSVDAITGEGLRLSFLHALALAEALEANDLGRYQAAHGKLARWPARMGRLMLYLGSHGGLRKRAMRAFSLHPELLGQLLAIHLGESSAAQLATATAQLGWGLLAA